MFSSYNCVLFYCVLFSSSADCFIKIQFKLNQHNFKLKRQHINYNIKVNFILVNFYSYCLEMSSRITRLNIDFSIITWKASKCIGSIVLLSHYYVDM